MKTISTALALVTSGIIATAATVSIAAEPMSEKEQVQANLKRFDQLDFDAYSHRKNMKLFEEIHCPDVKVVFPDGRTTHGIEQHLKDIEGLFNGTPDSRVTAHIPLHSVPVIGRLPRVFWKPPSRNRCSSRTEARFRQLATKSI